MKIVIPFLSDPRLSDHRQTAPPVRPAYHISAGLSTADSVPYSFTDCVPHEWYMDYFMALFLQPREG